jgi:hypothetical protein
VTPEHEENHMVIRVLDPRLSPDSEVIRPAEGLCSLQGTVVGLLDNAKIATDRFYDFTAEILKSQHGVREFIRRRKPDATRPASPQLLAELSGADAIISGIGD